MKKSNLLAVLILIAILVLPCRAEVQCGCGTQCSSCGQNTPRYMLAILTNLVGCPEDFQNAVAQVYPCFNGGSMSIILRQDSENQCGYYYNGPTFAVEGSPFDHRLRFYLSFEGEGGATEFWVIVQQDCGGWFDLCWSRVSVPYGCTRSGGCLFESLCNVPFPDIQSGSVSWQQAMGGNGNCPNCEPNQYSENCDDFGPNTLNQYTFFQGPDAYNSGPSVLYSPPECEKTAKKGNIVQTTTIYCPGAQLVSAQVQSSASADIIVSTPQSTTSQGDTAVFSINALRGKGQVTLTADFYKKAYSQECIALKTTKTIVIKIEPDNGDECCQDNYTPVLLKGSPGNVSAPVRAGTNPLNEWPQANIYRSGTDTDIEVILPGRFNPVIFNNSKPPQYLSGWKALIDDSNIITVSNPEGFKYVYKSQNNHKIALVKNPQDVNIVEFIYDANGLPICQNDLTDPNLYISYHYDSNNLLTEIREHAEQNYREFLIEYDSTNSVSYVSAGCSQCNQGGNRKYFYNPDGPIKYEKSLDNQIIYEYAFDQQQRLTEKWLGPKQQNNPVKLITYTADQQGYIADIKDYADNQNWQSCREYRSDSDIVTKRTTYQLLNENPNDPQGDSFTEYFIYDYNQTNLLKLTEIKPSADYDEQIPPLCARTEYFYDTNSGETLKKTSYDSNNNAIVIFENFYEYLNADGNPTNEVNEIAAARIIQSFDVYDANTIYIYNDSSRYPVSIILPKSQNSLSGGQLRYNFSYNSQKNITSHQFVENNSGQTKLTINYSYDEFGNLLTEQYTDSNDTNDIIEYYYDDYGQIARTKTAAGTILGKEYDNSGRLISEFTLADANDIDLDEPNLISQKRYAYDSNGLPAVQNESLDDGQFTFNNPEKWIYTQYQYDFAGRIVRITEDANGKNLQTTFEYNNQNEMTKITSPGGKWTEYNYDGRGLIQQEITGNDSEDILIKECQYDKNANLIRQNEPDGTQIIFEYDDLDRLIAQKQLSLSDANTSINTIYEYDSAGNINKETLIDTNGTIINEKTYSYDNLGRCKLIRQRKQTGTNDDANDFITLYIFDCLDNVTKKILKAPNSTDINSIDENNDTVISLEYDATGKIRKFADAEKNVTKFAYNPDGNIKSITNALDLTTTNTIDEYGRIIETKTPSGNYKKTAFDSLDRPTKETIYDCNDAAVSQKRFEYDNSGNTVKTITMMNPAEQGDANAAIDNIIEYDINEITGYIDSKTSYYNTTEQAKYSCEYDNIGRLIKITDPVGNSTSLCYDTNLPGQIITQQITYYDPCEPVVVTTYLQYDDFGRIKSSRLFDNNSVDFNDLVTQFEYDDAGNIIKQTKPGGLKILYEYDTFGNLIKTIEDANRTAEFNYDRLSRCISITAFDINSQQTLFQYNKNGQVTKIVYPDGKEEQYKYDASEEIIEKTNRNGQKIYFTYDTEDNLVSQSDDINAPQFLIGFEYDPTGSITYAEKTVDGQIISQSEFVYNGLGKITKETTSLFDTPSIVTEYNYDQAGNVIEQKFNSIAYNYTHDGLGRIKTIRQNDSQIAEIEYFASAVKKQKFSVIGLEYTAGFDKIARISRCKTIDSNGSTILDFSYIYDDASNRKPVAENYEYDELGRITKAQYEQDTFEEFSYKPFGSRNTVRTKDDFTETYYTNNLNQYTNIHTDCNFAGFTFDANLYWDDNGNLISDDLDGIGYQYDLLNNLVKVTQDTETIAEFTYDALGRRIRKKTAQSDTLYQHDLNNRIIAEYSIGETNLPTIAAQYVYGSGQAEIIARLMPEKPFDQNGIIKLYEFCQTYLYETGQPQFNPDYDYDDSGFVDLRDFAVFANQNQISLPYTGESQWYYLKDALGSTAGIISDKHNLTAFGYDCFGRVNTVNAASNFLFAGYYYDAEIEKYYCLNRYYDPDIGLFLSPDPLGFASSLNLYEYVQNNPVILTDPLGLKSSLTDELKFLVGLGKIRTDAKRLTENLKHNCQYLQTQCGYQPCIGKISNPVCRRAENCFEQYRKAVELDKRINADSAKAAAFGTLAGTTQGLLNTTNGIQDSFIGTANLGLGIWNYSGALLYDKKLDYIPSPDWSKDLLVKESQRQHNISKFLGSEGALTLASAGINQWRNAQLINKMQPTRQAALSAREGIYEFTASSGKTYVGQSANIPSRITRHIRSGKLLTKDISTLKAMPVGGGRIAREIAEQARIDRLGGVENLENVRNAIGPARKYLLSR